MVADIVVVLSFGRKCNKQFAPGEKGRRSS